MRLCKGSQLRRHVGRRSWHSGTSKGGQRCAPESLGNPVNDVGDSRENPDPGAHTQPEKARGPDHSIALAA